MGLADYITTGYDAAPVATRTPIVVQAQQSESDLYLPLLKARLALNASVSDYDAALKTLLAEAISEVEQYTWLSLQPSTVVASYAPYNGETLPYGPVWADPLPVLTATREGSTITVSSQTNGQVDAGPFPTLLVPFAYGTVAYKAGYSMADGATYAVPAGLIGAVLSYAADSWRSGGVTGGMMPTTWKRIAGPFRRFD